MWSGGEAGDALSLSDIPSAGSRCEWRPYEIRDAAELPEDEHSPQAWDEEGGGRKEEEEEETFFSFSEWKHSAHISTQRGFGRELGEVEKLVLIVHTVQ